MSKLYIKVVHPLLSSEQFIFLVRFHLTATHNHLFALPDECPHILVVVLPSQLRHCALNALSPLIVLSCDLNLYILHEFQEHSETLADLPLNLIHSLAIEYQVEVPECADEFSL